MNSAYLNPTKTHRQKLSIILLALNFFIANKAAAYDFSAVSSGETIYYNIIRAKVPYAVEVTSFSNTDNNYIGNIIIPVSVKHGRITYSVTSIGEKAFSFCSRLTNVNIPNSVTSIGEEAFLYCHGLTEISVAGDNPNYNATGGVLFNKSQTILIKYPEEKTGAAYNIPNSVTSIGKYAFFDCLRLTSVNIPNSVTSIGEKAFSGCRGLTSVNIPNSVTSIGKEVFARCRRLTSVNIPNSVTSIGIGAFAGCNGLTSVNIPNSVTSIGYRAFFICSELTEISVAGDNPNYSATDGVLFNKYQTILIRYPEGKAGVTYNIPNSVTAIGISAFDNCRGLTSVNIPNSVTNIEDYAFSDCSELTSINIPNSVTFIESSAFSVCSRLTDISVAGANPNYSAIDGVLFNKAQTILIQYPAGKTAATYNIPNSVTSIEEWAFEGCSGLTSITIRAVTPPEIKKNIFKGILNQAKVYVLCASLANYKTAAYWKDFTYGNCLSSAGGN